MNVNELEEMIPKKGVHRYQEMVSNDSSLETKANAARWYAEMMIDIFLSEEVKNEITKEKFHKLGLKEKIKKINRFYSSDIIEALYRIKKIGDSGSHYNPTYTLNEDDITKIVYETTNLVSLILIDYFNKTSFTKNPYTPKIFSILLPSIRVKVLHSLINSNYDNSQLTLVLLHKYVLALVKNNQHSKAKNILNQYIKKRQISNEIFDFEMKSIDAIYEAMVANELPIPQTIADCKRNLNEVLNTLSHKDKNENKGLINIIENLLDQFEPSDKIAEGNLIYLVF